MEKKLVHVQMPKPDNDEAVKLLAELVDAIEETLPNIEAPLWQAYEKTKMFLSKKTC